MKNDPKEDVWFGGEHPIKTKNIDHLSTIEEICFATWKPLYLYIYYRVQNREEAEDITQETYTKAILHLRKKNVRIDRHLSYLKTIALNIIRDRWRRSKRQEKSVSLDAINPMELAQEDPTAALVQQEYLRNALQLLNEEQRRIIDLRILKGYSVADTAKITNLKEGNVRVIQYRAIERLAKILENKE